MEVLSVNADQKIVNLASSIGRSPRSWKGWKCLYIDLSKIDDELYHDCIVWMKALIQSYLGDFDGCSYISNQKIVHILCKNVSHDVLEETGQQIYEFIYAEGSMAIDSMICDLDTEGGIYAQSVLADAGDILSFSSPDYNHFSGADLDLGDVQHEDSHLMSDAPKVLLVEDDPVTRWMVRKGLKDECDFAVADCGNKAFSMYSSFQPDVVFLDINLPDKSGHAILSWVLHNDPGACVVMFSSNDDLDNMTRALDAGASGFIAKPFLKNELLHYIKRDSR